MIPVRRRTMAVAQEPKVAEPREPDRFLPITLLDEGEQIRIDQKQEERQRGGIALDLIARGAGGPCPDARAVEPMP